MSGYNEDAYRDARESTIAIKCPFERALLSKCSHCALAKRLLLAEREAISCTDRAANGQCQTFHEALHVNARFALHIDPAAPWPFGKEIRAQCGGVLGLKAVLNDEGEATDIHRLIQAGIARFGSIEALPYSEIMRGVVHYEPRKRRGP
ncbi:MAG: hypothetical protein HY850_09090 [Betaproteobacteria bacterium]|nr:hypothetical protein [Betaproteobacteria bacterium]